MDKCTSHDEIMEKFTKAMMDIREMHIEMRADMKAHLDRCDREFYKVNTHVCESIKVRDQVRDNTKFRESGVWGFRAIMASIIGIIIKLVFWK